MSRRGRPLVPTITVADEACGPDMLPLTPAQRVFVYRYVHFGDTAAAAARYAGYSDRSSGAKVQGYRLLHDEGVQKAIAEESRKIMRAEGPRSIITLRTIRDDKSADAKDRIKAAIELLNRGGLHAVTEQHVSVEHRLSDQEIDARILALCAELKIPETEARKMLIDPAKVIDGEFSEANLEPPAPGERKKPAFASQEIDFLDPKTYE
jgi:phage terminase small subunit